MSLFITSLNSGSNGNCYYVGNDHEAVLIDVGISCREAEKRMNRLGLPMSKVKAIVVSHEHSDHITGVPGISKKYQIPVYITQATFKHSNIPVQEHLLRHFQSGERLIVGSILVQSFLKSHDAVDPHSFLVSYSNIHVGVFTDIGYTCKELSRYFPLCHAAFLESNYCDTMLENGNYPYHLKHRIRSNKGHLSNDQAAELFTKFRGPGLSHLILSHLSKNNNTPEKVENLFISIAGNTKITVASRYQETPVFEVNAGNIPVIKLPPVRKKVQPSKQLSLF